MPKRFKRKQVFVVPKDYGSPEVYFYRRDLKDRAIGIYNHQMFYLNHEGKWVCKNFREKDLENMRCFDFETGEELLTHKQFLCRYVWPTHTLSQMSAIKHVRRDRNRFYILGHRNMTLSPIQNVSGIAFRKHYKANLYQRGTCFISGCFVVLDYEKGAKPNGIKALPMKYRKGKPDVETLENKNQIKTIPKFDVSVLSHDFVAALKPLMKIIKRNKKYGSGQEAHEYVVLTPDDGQLIVAVFDVEKQEVEYETVPAKCYNSRDAVMIDPSPLLATDTASRDFKRECFTDGSIVVYDGETHIDEATGMRVFTNKPSRKKLPPLYDLEHRRVKVGKGYTYKPVKKPRPQKKIDTRGGVLFDADEGYRIDMEACKDGYLYLRFGGTVTRLVLRGDG